ncbi:PAS domain-containing protein [Sphingomonas sp. So64.6b]|uniref:chemotaxis protein CheB n=1 Tax=Sphingomonas sp. So64.6b TaxID=2997354 RepID=UPI0015FF86E5|nr:chemotaxis protein CheB [Sphingomonas sp. So64.6b]QNA86675.1 PAS domain-containing protein [Sphingomonas sp. So64.6b]
MLLIVGIGASAGGLDAFKSFFANTPADTGMAFVLVQHLSPDHKSMLAELLGRTTTMGVIEAADDTEVKPNCVFIIPPDATLTIHGGRLKVARPAPPRERRRPIDTFFQSLAEDQGENAIAIILAGTGSDGTLGLTAIKERGGLTLAQAEFDHHALPGMPQSATATGQVDEVLAVETMPARVVAYHKHLTGVAGNKDGNGLRQDAASHLVTIMGALRARSGHDFSEYKEKTLLRRLQRRMQVLQVETPGAYIERFRKQPEELDMLFRELLIGVTQFFRDPAAFEALATEVIKSLVAGKGADDDIRVWVPGCSTGQEAYSLAILIREAMDSRRPKPKVQIFGTDIDDRAIALARVGRYRKPVAGLSAERLDRWFSEEGGDYCVLPEIREMCVFSIHSIIKHPPFSKLDLISCRNLLIYIDAEMQDRVMRTFHYSLKPGGHLFLGSSESVTRATKLFGVGDKKHRIFQRREIEGASLPDLSGIGRRLEPSASQDAPRAPGDDRIDKSARRATEKYNPPHVVVDGRDQIVRFSGATMGQYVELASGAPSYALFDILRKSLRPATRAALKEVKASRAVVRHENVPIRIDGHTRLVTLIAEPLADQGADAGLIALVFQDVGAGNPGGPAQGRGSSTDMVKALEQELRTTRAQLQSTIDELEVANEELKSSNEEHQSVNEELQSSNEELETAKEEMQSVNEEVQTINSEMASKNELLTNLNSDLKNLLESTEIATLFLDGQLRVKSFTPGLTDIFHLRDGDVGRPVTEIVSLLDYGDLQKDVKTVLRKLTMVERQVRLKEPGASFVLRIRPYRTIDNVIDGVVLTFVDISERNAIDEALRQSERQFHALAESIPQLAWILDGEGSAFWFNRRWSDYTGTTLEDMKGWGWRSVLDPAEVDRVVAGVKRSVETGEVWEDTFPLRGSDGAYRWFLSRAEPIRDESGKIVRWFGTNTDIEDQRRSEELQELLLKEMDHRVKNLFAIVGGVVTLSARSAKTPKEMVSTIQGRLGALASAHVLIRTTKPGAGDKRESTLDALVRAILAPHVDPGATDGDARAMIEGPEVAVGGDAATSLALILHELATNAVKYGAYSTPGGRVRISWTLNKGKLELAWQERGGPPVNGAPEREGFGSLLARRSINGQLGGQLEFDWDAEGLTVRLSAAAERLMP